jgi:hypothetical protein
MTEFDREYMAERRADYYRDLYQTLDDEHRRGLNNDPFYGWTQREIDNYNASLNADREDEQEPEEQDA